MSNAPRLLFVTLANDPCSDRIVFDMGRLGAQCAVAGPPGAFAMSSRHCAQAYPLSASRWRPLRAFDLSRRLDALVASWKPDLVVPLDDLTSIALRDLRLYGRSSDATRDAIARSLGDPRHFEIIASRRATLRLARECGIRTPREHDVPTLAAAQAAAREFGFPVVLKRDLSCGGGGVVIVRDRAALARAYRRMSFYAAAKRGLAWIPGYRAAPDTCLTLQEYISGELAFRVSACRDGEEIEGLNFLARHRSLWDTRPSAFVTSCDHPAMAAASQRLLSALGVSGLASLDFILGADGAAYLLELNARPINTVHLGAYFGCDLSAALLHGERSSGDEPAPGMARRPRTVAVFPRAIDREPAVATLFDLAGIYHDAPWDDPGVLDAYRAWLDARHAECRPVLPEPPPPLAACSPPPPRRRSHAL